MCKAEVASDLWLSLHRHERPKLWRRALTLHVLMCPNGHQGTVRAPLLLFDPGCPFAVFVPAAGTSAAQMRSEGDILMGKLWEALRPDERRPGLRVEVVPREMLADLLSAPEFNLGEVAPGAPRTEQVMKMISEIHNGRASVAQLRAWAEDATLPPPLRSSARFDLATRLGQGAEEDPQRMEGAIIEWGKVLHAYPRNVDPRRWAIACSEFAECYAQRRAGDRAANLREALRLVDQSLEILTADRYPEDFALAQSRRGSLLLDLDEGEAVVEHSLAAYRAALTVYSRHSYPHDWALVLSNMATAYLTRGGTSRIEDIRRAISLLEQALEVRTRESLPGEWALTQMNLGLALSRLPATEGGDARRRAIESLRGALEVFGELGDGLGQTQASFNLGVTLARSGDPSEAQEAVERLEQTLPWFLSTGHSGQAPDAFDCLSVSYVAWLLNEPDPRSADRIAKRALAWFEKTSDVTAAVKTNGRVGLWLLSHSEGRPDRLELAGIAFERVLEVAHEPHAAEARASALANLATVLLLRKDGSEDQHRARAGSCIKQALRILRSLPPTPERDEQIGRIAANQTLSGLWTQHPSDA
jgi:tetratricopeptide (TPR) repeat protein